MPHVLPVILIVALVGLSLYRRVRRTIAFQPVSSPKLRARAVLFTVLGVLLLTTHYSQPSLYPFDALGAAAGGGIALISGRHTQFERRRDGWYFRPHPWLGILLVTLFVVRVAIRLYADYALWQSAQPSAQPGYPSGYASPYGGYTRDPWTAALLFTLITYYIGYYAAIWRRHRRLVTLEPEAAEGKAAEHGPGSVPGPAGETSPGSRAPHRPGTGPGAGD
ncbi:MAG: DUF1453 family protein [Alicyclobacillus sp.]|nr:DUF1453 family protein [Alicyclobacillus sp.]